MTALALDVLQGLLGIAVLAGVAYVFNIFASTFMR